MDWFKPIKGYYDEGFYTKDDVRIFVIASWITKEQYKQITAVDYDPAA
ncbi:XkdX family protein [Cytobacillus purgationiresistens]|uniref:XkdX family phage protein n=1 Tax=Cytobacillus purgationiresistens TaxID=863449 RepID=A0ABU0AF85_9BACI|nr:XkdX family protein [Cytobacillus purgationiresistens]MDQ0269923.1 putative XkdX family phage protein [Cytobacillus purgationiresistens]